MKRLTVGICVYKTKDSPEEKTGVLLDVGGKQRLVSLPHLTPVDSVAIIAQVPNTPDLQYDFGYTPEARKALKESRRLALTAN